MNRNSLANYVPFLRGKSLTVRTWATPGNTETVSDPDVKENSIVVFHNTSAYAGRWYISAISNGSFTITSSDAEGSPTYHYLLL